MGRQHRRYGTYRSQAGDTCTLSPTKALDEALLTCCNAGAELINQITGVGNCFSRCKCLLLTCIPKLKRWGKKRGTACWAAALHSARCWFLQRPSHLDGGLHMHMGSSTTCPVLKQGDSIASIIPGRMLKSWGCWTPSNSVSFTERLQRTTK